MKLSYRKLILGLMVLGCSLFYLLSCKKEFLKDVPGKGGIPTLMGPVQVDPEWLDMRNQAMEEYDFYFSSYHHKGDFLKEVDWEQAILNWKDGKRVMVFSMIPDSISNIQADVRLMVTQEGNGVNSYILRTKSAEGPYTSLYDATNKMIYFGSTDGGSFNLLGWGQVMSATVMGATICDQCHNGDGGGGPGGPPGGPGGPGGLWGNNWLDEVIIVDQRSTLDN